MNALRLAFGILIASSTVACGPRISQWIQVTDCTHKNVVVPNVRVYVVEDVALTGEPDARVGGFRANGGVTDDKGNTWASFSVQRRHAIQAIVRFDDRAKRDADRRTQPVVSVPSNPTQPIRACVNP